MVRSLEFTIPGDVDTAVRIEEGDVDGDGLTDLSFTLAVDESGGDTADLRLFAWDVTDEGKLPETEVFADASPDVTDEQFEADEVVDLGGGANLRGSITRRGNAFDAGVEIGTPGAGRDDISSTSFVVRNAVDDLTLDDVGGQRFGLRLTSVGEVGGDRDDSLKLATVVTNAPDAADDTLTTDEDTAASIDLLANDDDDDGDTLTVTAIAGGTIGTAFDVTSTGGRTASVTVEADGAFTVDPAGNFEDLGDGESDSFELEYEISDGNGGADHATVMVTIEGVEDATGGGTLDIVTTSGVTSVGNNAVSVLANNGDGTFASIGNFSAGENARSLALGDLDGDGFIDILTANAFGDNVTFLKNNGDGTFDRSDIAEGNTAYFVDIGDIDVDGDLDFAVAYLNLARVSIFSNNGDATFDRTDITLTFPSSANIADISDDGLPDLVVYRTGFIDSVRILTNNGDGTFDTSEFSVGDNPSDCLSRTLRSGGFPRLTG